MTIDERIEALTQSVELLASFHRDTETALQTLSGQVQQLSGQMLQLSGQVLQLSGKLDRLTTIVAPIAQLVLDHERRLNQLEEK